MEAGSELTFNYQFEAMGDQKKPCLCKSKNCSGLIGEKPLDSNALRLADANGGLSAALNGRSGRKSKPKVKKVPKLKEKDWEDLCFRCFDDGELLMCDYKTCPKVYHLGCLGR